MAQKKQKYASTKSKFEAVKVPKISQITAKEMAELKRVFGKDYPSKLRYASTGTLAKKAAGRALAKAIPGVGAAIVVHDVMRAGAKKGCIKRGGKWVGGKCQIAKKSKKKTSGPDPRFARDRRTKSKK
jgi:hypothetical protein